MMKRLSKKQTIGLIAMLGASILMGTCFYFYQKSLPKDIIYDYQPFYVEITEINEGADGSVTSVRKEFSLELLKQRNEDIAGILEFDEQIIYEPIVQAPDNDYYLRRNIDHQKVTGGISFVGGDGDVDSSNVVIYGHSSQNPGVLFTPLMDYLKESHYRMHPTFQFHTDQGTRNYQIIAVLLYDSNDPESSAEFTKFEWRKTEDFAEFIQDIKQQSLYVTQTSVSTQDKLMTLVTCDTRDNTRRVVVIAKWTKNE